MKICPLCEKIMWPWQKLHKSLAETCHEKCNKKVYGSIANIQDSLKELRK